MIAIIDYGLGNVQAFLNVFDALRIPAKIVREKNELKGAKKIILPGVGSFDRAINKLNASGLRHTMEAMVINDKVFILGVCVGMQILANRSDEGSSPGLGWVDATVKKFNQSDSNSTWPFPHMGWNTIVPQRNDPMFSNCRVDSRFYFLHSYFFECSQHHDSVAYTEYGGRFSSAINKKNIYGVQFHPEKSHKSGVQLLKNFANL